MTDSLKKQFGVDSASMKQKRMPKTANSGIDTTVKYKAKDSISFNVKSKIMRLRGDAKLKYRDQSLEAEKIEIHFTNSMLKSEGVRDSNKKIIGYPKFEDKGENFVGEVINYDFHTTGFILNINLVNVSLH